MTLYNRPRAEVFAENAPPSEIQPFQAWLRGLGIAFDETNGLPEMTGLNGLFNALNQYIKYLEQNGFAEWSSSLEYPVGAGVRVGSIWYRARTRNTNKPPATSQNDWAVFLNGADVASASTTVEGVVRFATALEVGNRSNVQAAVRPSDIPQPSMVPDATTSTKGIARFATDTEIANRSNVLAIVRPSHIPRPAEVPLATTTVQGTVRFATSTEVANRSNVQAAIRPSDISTASTTVIGISRFATATEVTNKTNVTASVNPSNAATIAQSTDLGVGQSYQDLTSSRSIGSTYTNNTGRPIFVSIDVRGSASLVDGIRIVVGGNTVTELLNIGENAYNQISFIVPSGMTYTAQQTSATISIIKWAELR